jgi:hypothetical protein
MNLGDFIKNNFLPICSIIFFWKTVHFGGTCSQMFETPEPVNGFRNLLKIAMSFKFSFKSGFATLHEELHTLLLVSR